jgi:SAM-dependent methyltransferase
MDRVGTSKTPKTVLGRCPVCASQLAPAFLQMSNLPTLDGAVAESLEEARSCPVGDVTICLCEHCSWIGNATFDPSKLSYEKYHFSLHHSPAFAGFITDLIDRLDEKHALKDANVLDVGCGSGDFLRAFADRVAIQGLGIDPSINPGTEKRTRGSVTFERGLLEARHAEFNAALICCRHVLNSMPNPISLLQDIRAVSRKNRDTVFYLEVPHADRTFGNDLVWNVAYEHHSWFNEVSFRVLCERAGFEVLTIGPCWRNEYLGAELRLATPRPDTAAPASAIEAQRSRLTRFSSSVQTYARRWSQRLSELQATGRRVAIWGAGARALLFLNQVENKDHIGMVVDINPTRQGKFLAHVGVRIDPPVALREFQPDLILVSNSAFADEIRQQAAELGLSAELEVF